MPPEIGIERVLHVVEFFVNLVTLLYDCSIVIDFTEMFPFLCLTESRFERSSSV